MGLADPETANGNKRQRVTPRRRPFDGACGGLPAGGGEPTLGGPAPRASLDVALVRRLLASQFPHWADLPAQPVPSAGANNAIFRLGPHMAVRLPRLSCAVAQLEKEQRWLPWLAPRLPLAVPVLLAKGEPAADYPWPWSVCRWLDGEPAIAVPVTDLSAAAATPGAFVAALQGVPSVDGPAAGSATGGRGLPLAVLDAQVHAAIGVLGGTLDAGVLAAAWGARLQAPGWRGAPVWFHGDLHAENLLVEHGRLCAVIDFGLTGVGDPACDLSVAGSVFSAAARGVFRRLVGADDATWARGRGWALALAVIALAHYRHRGDRLASVSRRTVGEVLVDHARES